jgi:sortase B
VSSILGRALLFGIFACGVLLLSGKKKEKGELDSSNEAEAVKEQAKGKRLGVAVGVGIMAVAVVYLGVTFFNYQQSDSAYDGIRDSMFANVDESGDEAAKISQIQANLAQLRLQNPDTIAWLEFDNISISYPIMQGNDDQFYLHHNFAGKEDNAGSIFMEAQNNQDFSDAHTIVYGHNMRNGSMFGQLKKYKSKDFYNDNRYFTVYTETDVHRYEIFAYYDIKSYGNVYTLGFGHDAEFGAFIDQMLRRSYYDCGVSVGEQDQVVTLSTCSTTGMRFVVHAKEVVE